MAARHSRHLAALALLLLAATLVVGCQASRDDGSLARVQHAGTLVIGIDPSYPPFAAIDVEGRPDGYEVDLAVAIAERIGVSAHFVGIDVGGIVDALLARKIDVVISGLTPDAGYGKRIAFSQAYFNNGLVVVGRQTAPLSFEALSGRSVAVESGSDGDLELRKRATQLTGVRIRAFTTVDLALDAVRLGEVDAAVADAATALEHLRRNPSLVASSPFTDQAYAVVALADDRSLLDAIDRAIADLEDQGYLAELQDKWLR